MKKVLARLLSSARISLALTLVMTAINYVTGLLLKHPFFSIPFHGGEVTTYLGAGIEYNKYYPFTYEGDPTNYMDHSIDFNLLSFLITWLLLFLAAFIVCMLVKKKKGADTDTPKEDGKVKKALKKIAKIPLNSATLSFAASSLVAGINCIICRLGGRPLFAREQVGSFYVSWIGSGIKLTEYNRIPGWENPSEGFSGRIEFNPESFLITWLVLFLAALVILCICALKKKNNQNKEVAAD